MNMWFPPHITHFLADVESLLVRFVLAAVVLVPPPVLDVFVVLAPVLLCRHHCFLPLSVGLGLSFHVSLGHA